MPSDPPLLMLAQGRRPRARREPKVSVRGLATHVGVVEVLKKPGRPGWMWAHYPAGEARDPRTGAKLKRMGAKAGWPDLLIVSPAGILHGLALKAEGGELSEAQEDFQRWAIAHDVPFAVVFSIDEAIRVTAAWGVLLKVGGAG